ncbi:MAG: hypothetical protein AB1757_21115 [Acidobacteriota bacterium]
MFHQERSIHSFKRQASAFLLMLLAIFTYQSLAQTNNLQRSARYTLQASQPDTVSDRDPRVLLASAKTVYVNSQSAFVKNKAMISALNDHKELRQYGLGVTDSMSSADLVLSIDRQPFTIEYSFTVIHVRTRIVVASGHVNSLFGTVPGKIANSFAKQLKAAHQPAKGK